MPHHALAKILSKNGTATQLADVNVKIEESADTLNILIGKLAIVYAQINVAPQENKSTPPHASAKNPVEDNYAREDTNGMTVNANV